MQNTRELRLRVEEDVWTAIQEWSQEEHRSTGLIGEGLIKSALIYAGRYPDKAPDAMTVIDLLQSIRTTC